MTLAPFSTGPTLSVIAPTFNERDNITVLVKALDSALQGVSWELIIVDDNSPDDTAGFAKSVAQRDARVRCLKRMGRRGLSSAAIEGFFSSSAPYIALIDADMQHDETRLPVMLQKLQNNEADIVIGSRYTEGGSAAGLSSKWRETLSRYGGLLARRVLRAKVSDPMSGFFAMRRDRFEALAPKLSGQGFKILVDILASASEPLSVAEVPFIFRERHAGLSKLDSAAKFDYLMLLLDKTAGQILPLRFILFCIVGTFGVGVHLAALSLFHHGTDISFGYAQALAAFTAMTTNFLLNNSITYRDKRLRSWRLLRGLITFYIVCSVGLFANVGVAEASFDANQEWWVAGILGALVGAVWNYAASSALTWKAHL